METQQEQEHADGNGDNAEGFESESLAPFTFDEVETLQLPPHWLPSLSLRAVIPDIDRWDDAVEQLWSILKETNVPTNRQRKEDIDNLFHYLVASASLYRQRVVLSRRHIKKLRSYLRRFYEGWRADIAQWKDLVEAIRLEGMLEKQNLKKDFDAETAALKVQAEMLQEQLEEVRGEVSDVNTTARRWVLCVASPPRPSPWCDWSQRF